MKQFIQLIDNMVNGSAVSRVPNEVGTAFIVEWDGTEDVVEYKAFGNVVVFTYDDGVTNEVTKEYFDSIKAVIQPWW